MLVLNDKDVNRLIGIDEAIDIMRTAFAEQAKATAAMQARQRCNAADTTMSTMSAVLPAMGVAGAKVYTTVRGKFTFVTVLFAIDDGRVLAVIEGDAMTRFRTSAVTAIVAARLASPTARTLTVFGTGVQAHAHVRALVRVRPIERVCVVGIEQVDEFVAHIRDTYRVSAEGMEAHTALSDADIVVTATRSTKPLFSGEAIKPGAFVAAIGSSKPSNREIDDATLRRAGPIVVEWRQQAKIEAGDLVCAAPGTFDWEKVLEIGEVLSSGWRDTRTPGQISVYKSVGVGLEDVALAGLLYQKAKALSSPEK